MNLFYILKSVTVQRMEQRNTLPAKIYAFVRADGKQLLTKTHQLAYTVTFMLVRPLPITQAVLRPLLFLQQNILL
jgi:hypothetical protein